LFPASLKKSFTFDAGRRTPVLTKREKHGALRCVVFARDDLWGDIDESLHWFFRNQK
jgi:hypothetical protein